MGLLDILNGMQNGPRGQRQAGAAGGGMSPIMMALLGLLAYKALKGGRGQPAAPASTAGANPSGGLGDILGGLFGGGRPTSAPGGTPTTPRSGGSLADMLPGGLGGLLGGAAAGSVLSSGLNNLIRELQQSGHGATAQSWVGSGPNQEIAPNDLANALGSDTLDTLSQQTGMPRQDLLAGLSQHLPNLVDQLTPNGRVPTEEEASRMV